MHATIAQSEKVYSYESLFLFFQAEDGIRDLTVTGVQTCALPIWLVERSRDPDRGYPGGRAGAACALALQPGQRHHYGEVLGRRRSADGDRRVPGAGQIGRASCRERV